MISGSYYNKRVKKYVIKHKKLEASPFHKTYGEA